MVSRKLCDRFKICCCFEEGLSPSDYYLSDLSAWLKPPTTDVLYHGIHISVTFHGSFLLCLDSRFRTTLKWLIIDDGG